MKIYSDVSLRNQFDLTTTSAAISRSLARLSTGKRVNSPGDDPAAYSIGLGFSNQIRGITQANLNTNQAIGLLQVADSGMESQLDLLQRMREISIEAANGSLTSADRTNLNKELQALLDEYRRIASDTDFNGTKLLDGSFSTRDIQIGADKGDTTSLFVGSGKASDIFRKAVGSGGFKARTTLTSAAGPRSITTADVNGDGKLDLIAQQVYSSGSTTGTVGVFLGTGLGTFQNQVTYAVGASSASGGQVIAKDVTGDGVVDIITADYTDNTVSILKGNGDGTFQTRVTLAAGTNPSAIDVGDFNNDGKLDIITTDNGSYTASVFINNGDGTFQSRVTFLTSSGTAVGVADFNNDGKLDFVVANAAGGASGLTTYYGNGAGSFTIGSTLTMGTTPSGLALGDINNDSYVDIVVSNSGSTNGTVMINNGTGNFSAGTTLTTGSTAHDVKMGDLNNDGNQDVVFVNQAAGALSMTVLLGLGNATFQTGTTLTTGGGAAGGSYEATLGDFDGDGVLDIAQADTGSAGTATGGTTLGVFLDLALNVTAEGDVNVLSQLKAQNLIKVVDTAISNIVSKRSQISAIHNRLESTMAANLLLLENYDDALSKVIDADVAVETAELTKNQVLQQAQIAVASQANLQLQTVMGLLKF